MPDRSSEIHPMSWHCAQRSCQVLHRMLYQARSPGFSRHSCQLRRTVSVNQQSELPPSVRGTPGQTDVACCWAKKENMENKTRRTVTRPNHRPDCHTVIPRGLPILFQHASRPTVPSRFGTLYGLRMSWVSSMEREFHGTL